jgi:hypothetical protein
VVVKVFQYIQRRNLFVGIDFVLSGMLLRRAEDVRAGDSSLVNPTLPFSIALSTFCMILLSR